MATIRDVARASHVSIATVSRVFNDSARVSEATRRRVLAAAERVSYWPNATARSLITNRTHTIGVLLPDLHGEFFSEVIRGIDLAARAQGFTLLVSRSSSRADELKLAVRSMRGRVDGTIIMAPDLDDSSVLAHCTGHVPVVLVNPEIHVADCATLSFDNLGGARSITRHLIAHGHRRIATIHGPLHNIDARQRIEGYRAALEEAGIPREPDLEIPGAFTERSGYDAAEVLVAMKPRPTAVFVANDHMAVGLMGALHDFGLQIPGDIALAGFDDIPMARYLTPPLTTVHLDVEELGSRAMQILLDHDENGRGERQHQVVPVAIVVRNSCGARASGDAPTRWNTDRPLTSRSRTE
jgi:LacI family transcriptional regulator